MKVIIIEGTDNVGKDTVIDRLTYEFTDSVVFHCEKPKSKTYIEQAAEQEVFFASLLGRTLYEYKSKMDDNKLSIIHNRSWYGESVYGCMYRYNNPIKVKEMINTLEKCLTAIIKPEDLCFITLLSDNADFLVGNDDGLSISNADREKIIQETQRFEEIFNESIIENKHIVYVNDGDKFRDKDDIYNEILSYIFPKPEPSVIATDEWLKKRNLTREQYNEIRNADKITDELYHKYIYPGSNLMAQQLFDIHAGIL